MARSSLSKEGGLERRRVCGNVTFIDYERRSMTGQIGHNAIIDNDVEKFYNQFGPYDAQVLLAINTHFWTPKYKLTVRHVAEVACISNSVAEKCLNKLTELGFLEKKPLGKGKASNWVVHQTSKEFRNNNTDIVKDTSANIGVNVQELRSTVEAFEKGMGWNVTPDIVKQLAICLANGYNVSDNWERKAANLRKNAGTVEDIEAALGKENCYLGA